MDNETAAPAEPRLFARWFPIGTTRYYVFLGVIAVFILGPLGGITASYMNFSLGFFVGGQVLAGILGSTITYFYGPEGKHGANYMQTAAASVASMAAMGVLIQAMVWLGLEEPPVWKLILYFLSVGMFGVGVGMIFTPILVDRLQLTYPSGLAVANILRALTDVRLLKRSVGQLATGIGLGTVIPLVIEKLGAVEAAAEKVVTDAGQKYEPGLLGKVLALNISVSTIGAGIILGARITVPAVVYAIIWDQLTPWLRANAWLGEKEPFRKFAFLLALGTIMGAAIVDIALILKQAAQRLRKATEAKPVEVAAGDEWKQTNTTRLVLWLLFWSGMVLFVSVGLLDVGLGWVLMAIALSFVMMLVNGISFGITDSNPISSAFVVSVVLMALVGLKVPIEGLIAASIVFVVTAIGGDMQQDRSTGWRLGTNRTFQFRYQVIGVFLGAVLSVAMAKVFMTAYPELKIDGGGVGQWQSAMTLKIAGAVRSLTQPKAFQIPAMLIGVAIGLVFEIVRKVVKGNERYRAWVTSTGPGFAFDLAFDCALVPSPYASSFAGFVSYATSLWYGLGGVGASFFNWWAKKKAPVAKQGEALPEDMSTSSLLGGGLIAGDSIAALATGIASMLSLGVKK